MPGRHIKDLVELAMSEDAKRLAKVGQEKNDDEEDDEGVYLAA